MPVFEQKLISPLAVRFTQEHIRTTFKDGRLLETSYEQITSKPGTGDYDVILEAPFPNIEIIRWHVPRNSKEPRDADHWFTLDNRRLYCLQRAAVAHWPRRVAVVVDLLYSDVGTALKKFDSATRGQVVTIGHSVKGPTIARWDWLWEIPSAAAGEELALQAIKKDDSRAHAGALCDAAEEPASLLDLALSGALGALPEPSKIKGVAEPGCATPSTADSLEDVESTEPAEAVAEEWWAIAEEGEEEQQEAQVGSQYQELADAAIAEVERQLRAPGNKGFVWVTCWNEWYLRHLGTLRSFLESRPDRFVVHPGRGRGYTVSLAEGPAKEAVVTKKAAGAPSARRWNGRGGAVQKRWVPAGSSA